MAETQFRFKQFEVSQEQCAMKINTDGVLLGAWVKVDDVNTILDIGTGTGVIAMMLAQRTHANRIVGVEIDEESLAEAQQNMLDCPWCDSLEAVHASVQEYASNSKEKFDLIVSNPPFFSGGTFSATQEKTDVRHTTKLSHSDLLRSAFSLLSPSGHFSVVLPHIEGLRFIELAEQYRLYCDRMTEVKSFPESPVERLLLSFGKQPEEYQKDTLAIRSSENEFSSQYKELTKDFYLKF